VEPLTSNKRHDITRFPGFGDPGFLPGILKSPGVEKPGEILAQVSILSFIKPLIHIFQYIKTLVNANLMTILDSNLNLGI